jgi:hypothetical protein
VQIQKRNIRLLAGYVADRLFGSRRLADQLQIRICAQQVSNASADQFVIVQHVDA